MRVWPLVILVALAGCVAPPEEDEPATRWAPCPQWIASSEVIALDEAVDGAAAFVLAPNATHLGHPFDLLELEMNVTGSLEMRFENDGHRLAIKLLTPEQDTRPFLAATNMDVTAQVFLTAVQQGTAAATGPVDLDVQGTGRLQVTATPWYRVCGVAAS